MQDSVLTHLNVATLEYALENTMYMKIAISINVDNHVL